MKKYLDEGGVLEAWAKWLVALHQEPEKPEKPIEFVEEFFGEKKNAAIAELTEKLKASEEALAAAQAEIAKLKQAQPQEQEQGQEQPQEQEPAA